MYSLRPKCSLSHFVTVRDRVCNTVSSQNKKRRIVQSSSLSTFPPLGVCSLAVELPSGDKDHFPTTLIAFRRHCPIPVNNIPALGSKSHTHTKKLLSNLFYPKKTTSSTMSGCRRRLLSPREGHRFLYPPQPPGRFYDNEC